MQAREYARESAFTNSVLLWRDQKAGVDKSELNMLRQSQCQVDNKRLVHFNPVSASCGSIGGIFLNN